MDQPGKPSRKDTLAFYLGYVPRASEPFSSMIIDGLLARLHQYQMNLLIYHPQDERGTEELYRELSDRQVGGLIFIPPNNRELMMRLAQSGMPVVAIADRAPEVPSVVVNDEMGAFMLAEHLSLRGYRKVMYRKDILLHESSARRYAAFSSAASYLGIEVIATQPADYLANISQEEESILLAPPGKRPSAVVSWVDVYVYPVLKFCKQHGYHVPKDLAVAGFDGINAPYEPARRLTTVQAPWLFVAEKAVDLVMEMMGGESVPKETVLPVDLVIGDTT